MSANLSEYHETGGQMACNLPRYHTGVYSGLAYSVRNFLFSLLFTAGYCD